MTARMLQASDHDTLLNIMAQQLASQTTHKEEDWMLLFDRLVGRYDFDYVLHLYNENRVLLLTYIEYADAQNGLRTVI